MEYPEKLENRDPRNKLHLREAYDIMLALGEVTMTQRAKQEVKAAGLFVPDKIMESDVVPDDANAVVGAFYFHDSGLYFPDNIVCMCITCGDALQVRPELESNKSKAMCCFCAADEMLKEYHETAKADDMLLIKDDTETKNQSE